jgi:hypothetical protein
MVERTLSILEVKRKLKKVSIKYFILFLKEKRRKKIKEKNFSCGLFHIFTKKTLPTQNSLPCTSSNHRHRAQPPPERLRRSHHRPGPGYPKFSLPGSGNLSSRGQGRGQKRHKNARSRVSEIWLTLYLSQSRATSSAAARGGRCMG